MTTGRAAQHALEIFKFENTIFPIALKTSILLLNGASFF